MAQLEASSAEAKPLKRANTMPASTVAQAAGKSMPLPRGGTLVKLQGVEDLGMPQFAGRMGRVVEMNGRSFMEDGCTELCTVLLDSRIGDYDRSSGVWVGVPVTNLKIVG